MNNVIAHNFGGIISKEAFVDQLGNTNTLTSQTQERIHSLYTQVNMNDRGEELDILVLQDTALNDRQKILYLLATIKERVLSEDVFTIEGLIALFLMYKEGLLNEEYTQLLKVASTYYNGDTSALENDITKYHLNNFCNNFMLHELTLEILGKKSKLFAPGKKMG